MFFSHETRIVFLAVNTLKVHQLKMKFQVHSNIMYSIYSLYPYTIKVCLLFIDTKIILLNNH